MEMIISDPHGTSAYTGIGNPDPQMTQPPQMPTMRDLQKRLEWERHKDRVQPRRTSHR